MKHDATICITCKKPTCRICSSDVSKQTDCALRTFHVRCTLVWKIGKKIYAFVFKIETNAFYVVGIYVIHITVQYCAMRIFTIVVELCKELLMSHSSLLVIFMSCLSVRVCRIGFAN